MGKSGDLLQKMKGLVDDLLENATSLHTLSQNVISSEEVEKLQKEQQVLIQELIELDKHVQKEYEKDVDQSTFWEEITDKLSTFQDLNDKFMTNLKVRSGIIEFELNDIQKTRQALNGVKKVYVERRSDKPPQGGSKINTLS